MTAAILAVSVRGLAVLALLVLENLSAGPGHVAGSLVSLAVLGTGVVLLSIWAPPVMTAEELAPLHHGPRRPPEASADRVPELAPPFVRH